MSRRAHSWEPLRWMYMVASGFALTKGVETILEHESGRPHLSFDYDFIIFLIFVTFLIRFAHGALRHFDLTYDDAVPRGFQLPMDFIGLFTEAVLFIFMALTLRDHDQFAVYLLVLVVADSLWLAYHRGGESPYDSWIVANMLFVCVWVPVFILKRSDDPWFVSTLATISLTHFLLDYCLPGNWQFYFGANTPEPIDAVERRLKRPATFLRDLLLLVLPGLFSARLRATTPQSPKPTR